VNEVTCAEYAAFLSDIPADEARELVPRFGGRGVFFRETERGPYRPPPRWPPTRPVTGVTHAAAERYARWKAEKEGRPYRLPTEAEWEKAARAAGAFLYPWGDDFDPDANPRFANIGLPPISSAPARAGTDGASASPPTPPLIPAPAGADGAGDRPEPVGSRPLDRSLHGALDLMGNAAEWTSSPYRPGSYYRVVRGGAYLAYPDPPRPASRYPTDPKDPPDYVGFRLACDLP
jgi:formylglycine-generating enzyme required for sulfatase activity